MWIKRLCIIFGVGLLTGCGGGGGGLVGTVILSLQTSGVTGVTINVSPADLTDKTSGTTPFNLVYDKGTTVTLSAPATYDGYPFTRWQLSTGQQSTSQQIQITVNNSVTAIAVYDSGTCDEFTFVPNYVPNLTALLHWPDSPVAIYFVQDSNFTPELRNIALAGFDQWAFNTGGKVDYFEVSVPELAQIRILFKPTLSSNVLGVTYFSFQGEFLMPVVEIQLRTTWNNQPIPDADLSEVAAHEMGHALGIYGHSDDPNDIMYPSKTLGVIHNVTLRDTNTVKTAYCWLFTGGMAPMQQQNLPVQDFVFRCPEVRH